MNFKHIYNSECPSTVHVSPNSACRRLCSKVCPLPHIAVVHGRTSNRQESSIEQFCKILKRASISYPLEFWSFNPRIEGARALGDFSAWCASILQTKESAVCWEHSHCHQCTFVWTVLLRYYCKREKNFWIFQPYLGFWKEENSNKR